METFNRQLPANCAELERNYNNQSHENTDREPLLADA